MVATGLAASLLGGMMAAAVAVAATRCIESFGGTVGGVLASMPSTVVPASIGIALHPEADLTIAMWSVPLGVLIDSCFLTVWLFLPPVLPSRWSSNLRLALVVLVSLVVWLLLALVAVGIAQLAGETESSAKVLGGLAFLCTATIGVITTWTPTAAPKGQNNVSWLVLLARGLLAGASIAVAIAISTVSDTFAGVATMFPSVFVTTMCALWMSQGSDCQLGAVGPLIIGGVSVDLFALTFAAAAPAAGVIGGAVLAWLTGVLAGSVPVYAYLQWRGRVHGDGVEGSYRAGAEAITRRGFALSIPSDELDALDHETGGYDMGVLADGQAGEAAGLEAEFAAAQSAIEEAQGGRG